MQLNTAVDSNKPIYLLYGVPDFQFLDIEDEDEDEANTNLVEANLDANT